MRFDRNGGAASGAGARLGLAIAIGGVLAGREHSSKCKRKIAFFFLGTFLYDSRRACARLTGVRRIRAGTLSHRGGSGRCDWVSSEARPRGGRGGKANICGVFPRGSSNVVSLHKKSKQNAFAFLME